MMEGIEILSSTEIVADNSCNTILVAIVAVSVIVIGIIIGLILSIREPRYNKRDCILSFTVVGVAGSIVFGGIVATCTMTSTYETHYKVTLSDDVSFNEFIEKYEIIDQEGQIYTIRERRNDKSD